LKDKTNVVTPDHGQLFLGKFAGVIDIMRKMNKELNTTFIFSTHDPMVMKYANRYINLKDGMISFDERRG